MDSAGWTAEELAWLHDCALHVHVHVHYPDMSVPRASFVLPDGPRSGHPLLEAAKEVFKVSSPPVLQVPRVLLVLHKPHVVCVPLVLPSLWTGGPHVVEEDRLL